MLIVFRLVGNILRCALWVCYQGSFWAQPPSWGLEWGEGAAGNRAAGAGEGWFLCGSVVMCALHSLKSFPFNLFSPYETYENLWKSGTLTSQFSLLWYYGVGFKFLESIHFSTINKALDVVYQWLILPYEWNWGDKRQFLAKSQNSAVLRLEALSLLYNR